MLVIQLKAKYKEDGAYFIARATKKHPLRYRGSTFTWNRADIVMTGFQLEFIT
jgi:hypothetical protein